METQNSFKMMFNNFLANESSRLNPQVIKQSKSLKQHGTNNKKNKSNKSQDKHLPKQVIGNVRVIKAGSSNIKEERNQSALMQIQKDLNNVQQGIKDFNKKINKHYHLYLENDLEKTKLEQYKLKNDLQEVTNQSKTIKEQIYEIQFLLQKENDKSVQNQEEFSALCTILNKYLS